MKRDWSDGYVSDITYSHGYFHELDPAYLRFHLLVNGLGSSSDEGTYSYCELGYGQGVSAVIHAAANPRGEFWGTDFNPAHAHHAKTLSRHAGIQAHWLDLSFEALLEHNTPSFDFIVLHGVWSWISPAGQHAVVEFIRRKLKAGGVVFISYNVLPGWNAEKPLRDLLWLHTEYGSPTSATTSTRIASALRYASALREHGCALFTENVRSSQVLNDMLSQPPESLAHEYFNRSWWLTSFAEVERALEAARLDFACSVHLSDVAGEVRQRLANAAFLDGGIGHTLRETTTDFILNRRFRRDVFTRGRLSLTPSQRRHRLSALKFCLIRPLGDIPMFLTTPYGRLPLDEAKLKPMLEALATSDEPMSFPTLMDLFQPASDAFEDFILNLARLVARRDLAVIFPEDAARAKDARAEDLNTALCERSWHDGSIRYLASPVTGSAVEAGDDHLLLYQLWQQGSRTTQELAKAFKLSLPPKEDGSVDEAVHALCTRFVDTTAPIWRRLGILDSRPPRRRK